MLLCWLWGAAAGLGLLGLAVWSVVRRHGSQDCAVVRLGAALGRRQLEGALRRLARQRGGFRRVYLWDTAPEPWRRQMIGLLGRELGLYPLTGAELAWLQKQGRCRLFYLDTAGRLHPLRKL